MIRLAIALILAITSQAALTFSGTNRVTLANAGNMNDLAAWSIIYWLNPSTPQGQVHRQDATGFRRTAINDSNTISSTSGRTTSDDSYDTNNASLTAGAWAYVAIVYDSAASSGERFNVYKGTLTSLAVELTYSATQDGSGSVTFTGDINIGNRSSGSDPFLGTIAIWAQWNRALTLDEVRQQQFRPRVTSGCITFLHMGFGGTSTVRDWSGLGNNGTITGASYSAHPPIGSPFALWKAAWRELWAD